MSTFHIQKIRECEELAKTAAVWFHEKWNIQQEA